MEVIELNNTVNKMAEIITTDFFKIKYCIFDAGKGLFGNSANGIATIYVIEGKITFVMDESEKKFVMERNSILEFDAQKKHSLIAHENSKILMTIVPIK